MDTPPPEGGGNVRGGERPPHPIFRVVGGLVLDLNRSSLIFIITTLSNFTSQLYTSQL